MTKNLIKPNWSVPDFIQACTTTKELGNIAAEKNLKSCLNLPNEALWLNQTHTDRVIHSSEYSPNIEADACWTDQPGQVCVSFTADCLPVLIADIKNKRVAAVHAGWRGLSKGIIQKTLHAMKADPEHTSIWLGPAICQKNYEIGPEVKDAFLATDPKTEAHFLPSEKDNHFYVDLFGIAKLFLKQYGISKIYGGDYCTFSDSENFFSYRRDKKYGRIATLIWMTS